MDANLLREPLKRALSRMDDSSLSLDFITEEALADFQEVLNGRPAAPPQSDDALKPCPFCGGKATVQHWSWPYPRWRVLCSVCRCQASGRRADPSDAITAWEARTASHAQVVPLDAAVALVPEGYNFGVGYDAPEDDRPGSWAWISNRDAFEIERAETPALALCAAIRKATA